MITIPKVQTTDRNVNQLQSNIATALKPVLSSPLFPGSLVKSVSLQSGSNQVPHGLGTELTGWFITRLRGSASIYDQQDSNVDPTTFLTLVSSAAVVVDVYCF